MNRSTTVSTRSRDAPPADPRVLARVLDAIPLGVVLVDARGVVQYGNKTYRDRWGRGRDPAAPVQGQLAALGLRDADGHPVPADELPIAQALSGRASEATLWYRRGTERGLIRAIATPTVDRAGAVVGAAVVLADVGADEAELRQIAAIIERVPVGVVVFGADRKVRSANPAARQIAGALDLPRRVDDLTRGRTLTDVETGAAITADSTPLARALRGESVDHYTIAAHSPAEPDRFYAGSAIPLRDPEGIVTGALLLISPADEAMRRRAEERRGTVREALLALLTPREQSVLAGIAAGHSNREIASRLGITYSTVRAHVRGLLMKLGVHTRLEAAARADAQRSEQVE